MNNKTLLIMIWFNVLMLGEDDVIISFISFISFILLIIICLYLYLLYLYY